jgi:hypothetical protein
MKTVVALFALCALFPGPTHLALAQDDSPPKAPAPAAPGDRGTAARPPRHGNTKTTAAGAHQKEDSRDIAPPEDDDVPDASDPYARDPYETEPSEEEGRTGDDVSPKLDEPSAGSVHEPDDAHAVDGDDTDPDDAAGD